MAKTSSAPALNKNNNQLFSGCSSVRSCRTKLRRWYNKGIPKTDLVHYGRISAGYTCQRIALKTYKKERDILDYEGMLQESGHCVIRGAIDADALSSIRSEMSCYSKSHQDTWCRTVPFSDQVFQKRLEYRTFKAEDLGFPVDEVVNSDGIPENSLPFTRIWLNGLIRLNFPHFHFVTLTLLKNNCKSKKWKDDPSFHTDIPPGWTGDTSGIDQRPNAPIALWFPLDSNIALDYKTHTNKNKPQVKSSLSSITLKPTDLLLFDRNTFLHRSSKPIQRNKCNFRLLITLSHHLNELM
jgi:hypothetical protein